MGHAEVAYADDDAEFNPYPTLIGQGLFGVALGEDKSPYSFFLSAETGALHPIWLDVRARLMNTYEKFDVIAGYIVSHHYGDGDESYNVSDKIVETSTSTTTYYHSQSQDATVRDYWIVAGGVRTVASIDSVQPGETTKSTAIYPMALAGVQFRHDSNLGAHKVVELYGTYRPGGGAGFLACVHASFNAFPRIAVGTELAYSPLSDKLSDLYFTLDIGLSFGH